MPVGRDEMEPILWEQLENIKDLLTTVRVYRKGDRKASTGAKIDRLVNSLDAAIKAPETPAFEFDVDTGQKIPVDKKGF